MTNTPLYNDFMEICELKYRYAAGIDTRDWALLGSIFTEEIVMDFSSYHGRPALTCRSDDWVRGSQPILFGLAATQHTMTNPRLTVDGETAQLKMYMQAEHVLDFDDPTAWFSVGGYYTDNVVRTLDGWKLSSVALTVFWRRGRADIMETAVARGAKALPL